MTKARLTDDDWADEIVRNVRPARAPRPRDVILVKEKIESLRFDVREAVGRPRPSETEKKLQRVLRRTEELSFAIDDLGARWRSQLALRMFSGSQNGRTARMNKWIADLKNIPLRLRGTPLELDPPPKLACAFYAHEILLSLSPAMPLAKGQKSKLCETARSLWQAATGEPEGQGAGLKSVCDQVVDMFKDVRREEIAGHYAAPFRFKRLRVPRDK